MYGKCGLLVEACQVFDKLPFRDVVSWTVLIAGCAELGFVEEVQRCLKNMQLEGVSPDASTFVCSLKACGIRRALETGREIHCEIVIRGLEQELYVGHTLVDMYAKCGSLVEAQELFDQLPVRSVVPWTALISGYVENGLGEEALNCLEQMQQEGVSPVAVTFVCSLKACSIAGALEAGREIHSELTKRGLEIELYVGTTLVDMYAKCGSLAEAQEVLSRLPVLGAAAWNALIAGYVTYVFCETVLSKHNSCVYLHVYTIILKAGRCMFDIVGNAYPVSHVGYEEKSNHAKDNFQQAAPNDVSSWIAGRGKGNLKKLQINQCAGSSQGSAYTS